MDKKQLLFLEEEGYVIDRVDEILANFPQFEVTRLQDAKLARPLLKEKNFDVLITAIYLRGASGLELSFLAREKNKDVCVIILTGLDNADLAAKAVTEGAFDFIIKPPGIERLSNILKILTLVRGLALPENGPKKS